MIKIKHQSSIMFHEHIRKISLKINSLPDKTYHEAEAAPWKMKENMFLVARPDASVPEEARSTVVARSLVIAAAWNCLHNYSNGYLNDFYHFYNFDYCQMSLMFVLSLRPWTRRVVGERFLLGARKPTFSIKLWNNNLSRRLGSWLHTLTKNFLSSSSNMTTFLY